MPYDNYGGGNEDNMDEAKPMAGEDHDEAKPHTDKDEEGEQTTALLPKSILAGKTFNPGDEVVLKVEHIYEDEVEVSYGKGESSKESMTPKSQMEESEGALDKMAMAKEY